MGTFGEVYRQNGAFLRSWQTDGGAHVRRERYGVPVVDKNMIYDGPRQHLNTDLGLTAHNHLFSEQSQGEYGSARIQPINGNDWWLAAILPQVHIEHAPNSEAITVIFVEREVVRFFSNYVPFETAEIGPCLSADFGSPRENIRSSAPATNSRLRPIP